VDRLRLLPGLALCQAFGIWFADRWELSSELALIVGWVASLVGLPCVFWPGSTRRSQAVIALLACVVMIASGAYSIGRRLESAARHRPVGPVVRTIEATVASTASGPGWTRVGLVDAIDVDSGEPAGRITVLGGPSESDLPGIETAAVGTRLRARLALRPARGAVNPGSNPRERGEQRSGVAAIARLVHPAMYVKIAGDSARFAGWDAWRARIGSRLATAGPGSELVRAISIGDRSAIGSETRRVFRRLGLSHLLAISGLHLVLVGSSAFAGFHSALGRSSRLAARWDTRTPSLVAALCVATGYALIAGWGVPVRRAWMLLLALAVAVARGRAGRRAEPIAMAAIAVLAAEPGALFDPGAQLSFAAAAALAYSVPRRLREPAPTKRAAARVFATDAMRASASAIAATAPLAAWHFGTVAPLALVANLIAIPWTGFVLLPAALCAALAASIGFDVPALLASWIASGSLAAAQWGAQFAGSWWPTPDPSLGWKIAIAGGVVATIRARRTGLRVGLSLAVSAALILAEPAEIGPRVPRMVALDVGQGAATLVQGRHSAMLFDGGGTSGNSDWGERAILPALRSLRIERLDRVIVSHGDLDHRGGIPHVVERVDIGEVWIPFGAREAPEFSAILAAARSRGIPVSERGLGSRVRIADEMTLTGLWPPRSGPKRSRNSRSLVLRVDVVGSAAARPMRLLIPGDIEADAEGELLARGADLRADVLLLAHHGSRTSSSRAFLDAVGAQIAIASAPCAGRFEMPHAAVRDRVRETGMSLWWTGRDGAVLVGGDGPLTAWGYRDRSLQSAECASSQP